MSFTSFGRAVGSIFAEIFQALEADQAGLHVIQNYFVKNASTPPRTQLSTHSYEIYLPEGAQIEGSAAMAPALIVRLRFIFSSSTSSLPMIRSSLESILPTRATGRA